MQTAINELELGISSLDTFKEKFGLKLIGFEIPIRNALKILKELKEQEKLNNGSDCLTKE